MMSGLIGLVEKRVKVQLTGFSNFVNLSFYFSMILMNTKLRKELIVIETKIFPIVIKHPTDVNPILPL